MATKISRSGYIGIIALLVMLLIVLLFTADNYNSILFSDFIYSCKVCAAVITVSGIILINLQNNIFTIANISYAVFMMFQFGIPFLYVINPDYYNFYTTLFDEKILNNSVIYTTLCILFWCMGIIVCISNCDSRRYKILFSRFPIMNDAQYIRRILKYLIVITGLIVIPLFTYYAFLTLQNGFSQEIRRMLSSNALFRFGNAFFLPACILYRCYSTRMYCRIIKAIDIPFLYICGASLIIGDRTTGISWLLVFFYDIYSNYQGKRNKVILDILLCLGIFLVGILSAFIAYNRVASTGEQMGILEIMRAGIFTRIIEELGFNFYSISFVNLFVPSSYDYQYGLSYIYSFLSLIPSTFDFWGVKENIVNPTQWLLLANHSEFGSLLDFGTGFSFIAETYMNFTWLGCAVSFIMPLFLRNIFGPYIVSNNWERYVLLIFIFILITFPRRSLVESLVVVEYAIFFLGLYFIITWQIFGRHKKNNH